MKKILSILLALCMVLTMLPISVMAVEPDKYNVWVGGIQVTNDNKDNITGSGITGTVSYNPTTNTLTLNNSNITKAYVESFWGDTICIYSQISNPMILKLIGENSITGVNSERSTYGIRCNSKLTIEGEGSLTVTPGKAYINNHGGNNDSSGILTERGLTINNTTLNISGEQNGLYGDITINGGDVMAYGGNTAIKGNLKTNGQKFSVMVGDKESNEEWDGITRLIYNYKYVKIRINPYFIADISMTNATSVEVNTDLTLGGTVDSDPVKSHTILWSVQNAYSTGATINEGIFRATSAGTAKVKASVANGLTASDDYTKTFDITVTAAPVVTHTITATAITGGSISPSGSVTVNNGESQTFTITPNGNYSIGAVMVDGVNQGAISTYTFSNVIGEHNISATFNFNGGSGSSSSGRTPSNNSSIIITRPTADQPDRPTQGEIKVPSKVDGKGNITVGITDKNVTDVIEKALADAKQNGNEQNGITIVLRVDNGSKTASNVKVNLPKTVQDIIIANQIVNTIVVVDNPDIRIDMDLSTIKEINGQAKSDVNITAAATNRENLSDDAKKAIGSRPAFDLKVNYGIGKQVQDFGTGSVWVTIPYTLGANEKAENVFAIYIDDKSTAHWLNDSVYDRVNEVLCFSTNHFSTYGVGYKEDTPTFIDIANHWAKEDIEFVIKHGLFGGTSDTTFSPDIAVTRGMFVTVLGRLANADVGIYKESSFTDVKDDAYYIGYIEWARENRIVNGTGDGTFAPNQSITREQMAVIMQNYAKIIGFTLLEVYGDDTFVDSDNISAFAKDAVRQIRMAGVIGGKNGNIFDPQGTATRAEVSAVLRRFMLLEIPSDTM